MGGIKISLLFKGLDKSASPSSKSTVVPDAKDSMPPKPVFPFRRIKITNEEAERIGAELRARETGGIVRKEMSPRAARKRDKAFRSRVAVAAANAAHRETLLKMFSDEYPGKTAQEIQAELAGRKSTRP